MLALVAHLMNHVAPCEDAVRGVAHDRAILPATLPELVDDLHIFVGEIVAIIMGQIGLHAHGARRAVLKARDHIPAHAAMGQVIERREAPRQQVGLLEGEIGGDAEAHMFRRMGHAGDQQKRVIHGKHGGALDGGARAALIDVIDAIGVGEENGIEQAALSDLCDLDPVIEAGVAQGLAAGRAPQTDPVLPRRVREERVDRNFLLRLSRHGSTSLSPPAAQLFCWLRHYRVGTWRPVKSATRVSIVQADLHPRRRPVRP